VRINGAVRDCAVFTAIGIRRSDGKRMALGVSAEISDAEPHWRAFINTLTARGIGIPDLGTSDAHEGLKAALRATLPSPPWQRCQFHLQQNAQAYVPQVAMRASVAADIRSIFSIDTSDASPQAAEAAANTTIPARNMRLRPKPSPKTPPSKSNAASGSENPLLTHSTSGPVAAKSACTLGITTLRAVPSMNAMLEARIELTKTHRAAESGAVSGDMERTFDLMGFQAGAASFSSHAASAG
jgi:hypothetical protein